MNKQMLRIEAAIHEIGDAMENGKFTRHEIEGIKMFFQAVMGITDRLLSKSQSVVDAQQAGDHLASNSSPE